VYNCIIMQICHVSSYCRDESITHAQPGATKKNEQSRAEHCIAAPLSIMQQGRRNMLTM
jgi:hypothetical protein